MALQYRRYKGPTVSNDPLTQNDANQQFYSDTGTGLMDSAADFGEYGSQEAEMAGDRLDDATNGWLQGDGGLNSNEKWNLHQYDQDLFDATHQTADDYNGKYYTDPAKMDIMGDVNKGTEYFDPNAEKAHVADANKSRLSTINDMQNDLYGAYDPSNLRMSNSYATSMNNANGRLGSELDSNLSNPNLDVSADFQNGYKMSQSDQDAIVDQASRNVAAQYQGDVDDLQRRSDAAGMSPLGAASASQRMRNRSAVQQADAASDARIAASNAAADRLKGAEELKLGAAQNKAQLGYSSALAKNSAATQAAQNVENTRMAGEESVANKNLASANTIAQSRYGTQKDIADRDYEQNQDIRNTGLQLGQYQDQVKSARAKQIADSDVAGNTANTTERLNNWQTKYNAETGLANTENNAAQSDKNTAYDWSKTRYGQGNTNANNGLQTQLGAFGTTGQLANQANSTATGYKTAKYQVDNSKPGLFSQIMSGVSGAAGALGSLGIKSDRNIKHGFEFVNQDEILDRLERLPVAEWSYDGEAIRHIGPMAQDFKSAFGLGDKDTEIHAVDAIGVLIAAVQALSKQVKELENK